MFSERLENLIKSAIQDGILTEQEKAAIIKRAEAEGEDINEVDIYIQSLMQKRQQELNERANAAAAEEKKARKEAEDAAILAEKERDKNLRKCPRCSEYIPVMKNICPYCGQAIATSNSTTEIQDMISYLDTAFAKLRWDGEWKEGEISGTPETLEPLLKKGHIDSIHDFKGKKYWGNYQYIAIKTKLRNLYGEEPTVKAYLESLHKKECFTKLAHAIDDVTSYNYEEKLVAIRREIEYNYSDLNIKSLLDDIEQKKIKFGHLEKKETKKSKIKWYIIGAVIILYILFNIFS